MNRVDAVLHHLTNDQVGVHHVHVGDAFHGSDNRCTIAFIDDPGNVYMDWVIQKNLCWF